MKTVKYAFIASAVVFVLLQITYYPQLPDNVAIHFNTKGEVNGWMQKNVNLLISSLIIVITSSVIMGLPYLLRNTSGDLISIPQKEYWLSMNNKERLIRIVSTYLYAIGLAINLFMIFVFHQLYRFNIHAIDRVSIVLGVPFVIVILGMAIHLLIRLKKCV